MRCLEVVSHHNRSMSILHYYYFIFCRGTDHLAYNMYIKLFFGMNLSMAQSSLLNAKIRWNGIVIKGLS